MKYSKLNRAIHKSANEVYYLDCSNFPNGTHKDLRSQYIINGCVKKGIKNIHLITTGNAGLSLKKTIEEQNADIFLTNIVDSKFNETTFLNLESDRSMLKQIDLDKEFLSQNTINSIIGQNSLDVTYFESSQYDSLFATIIEAKPTHIIVPVGSGELYNCCYNYISQQNLSIKLIGILPKGNHPLSKYSKKEDTLAEKLYCKYMYSDAKRKILESISKGHTLIEVSNDNILYGEEIAIRANLDLELSGSVSFSVLNTFIDCRLACILTGKGNC